MDTLLLSRLQFAVATLFHFLFVPLTLGLSVLVATMETRYVRTGNPVYLRMTKFWGKIFLINFVVGIVTGISLEFQFGTNWSRYSIFVGDIFGSLLAIEATAAFFLESTLIGVWAFGWNRLSKKAHAAVIWLIAIASTVSAYWILAANSWMQHPVGYEIRNGRAELTDFFAVVTSKFAVLQFLHTVPAAYILGGFFVMGISAWHLLRKNETDFFTRSFRTGLALSLVMSLFVFAEGHMQGADLAEAQPAKVAAMEGHWETSERAPIYLFSWPDQENQKNAIEILPVPGLLSLLAHHDMNASVTGLKDIPRDEQPPVLTVSLSFKLMVCLGILFILQTLYGFFVRNRLAENPRFLKMMVWSIPLPYIACSLGWIMTEMGRQPWIVYGMMKTSDAHSATVAASSVGITLVGFILVYSILGAAGFGLMAKTARKGPEPS
ncbi:MAG: cytochrome ubiquinol oxidase subunit I [Deltaproteobacteria bacterium]|nr:cytochrome ubiquinol oxidase subunit I [Deltaproteobacteria bacterium]